MAGRDIVRWMAQKGWPVVLLVLIVIVIATWTAMKIFDLPREGSAMRGAMRLNDIAKDVRHLRESVERIEKRIETHLLEQTE